LRPPNNEETTNNAIAIIHRSIPVLEPGDALPNALKGGYAVQPPLKGPVSTNMEESITTLAAKKNQ
jgi:hypothetical protein